MNQFMTFRDHHREGRLLRVRLIWCLTLVFIMSLTLVSRMVWLQVYQHERYTTLSDKNRIQTQAIPPPRGLILDRHGRVLADNQPDFTLSLIPEIHPQLDDVIEEIATLIQVSTEDIERFRRRLQSPRRPWEPVPLRSRLSDEDLAIIAANQHRLQGVRLEATAIRHYPHGELFSHVVGYVNRINSQDLNRMTPEEQANYSATHHYGRSGVEHIHERHLHGQVGFRKVETNARNRILRILEENHPAPGNDLQLYLDIDVQKAAWEALEGHRGAIAAIDPRDGGVIAFVSRPGFDPNLFVTGISHHDYNRYRDDVDRPLFNRTLQGQYPPGSTVKPMIGLAGLEAGVTDWERTIRDPGYFRLEGSSRVFRDWRREGHGMVDMHKAVVESCDTYFYDMGHRLGIDRLSTFLEGFGLGVVTGIDLPNETRGIRPSREWKRTVRGESWFNGDTINVSIGQGYMLMTPLQLAQATAILARHGKVIQPRVARAAPGIPAHHPPPVRDAENWQRMNQAMQDVAHGQRGTARASSRDTAYRIAGKTGTSQVFSLGAEEEYDAEEIEERLRDHALYIAFAPADEPAIALAVLVENGGSGGAVAAPVARKIMDAWLLDEQGQLAVPKKLGPIHSSLLATRTTADLPEIPAP